jgi:ethanolaminephosphotransferase
MRVDFGYLQITLTGLAIVFLNFLTMLYYDPMYLTEKQGAAGPPHWVYFTYVDPLS